MSPLAASSSHATNTLKISSSPVKSRKVCFFVVRGGDDSEGYVIIRFVYWSFR